MTDHAKIRTAEPPLTIAPSAQSDLIRRLGRGLRDFAWLTRSRIVFYSGVLLMAYVVAAAGQFHNAHGLVFESGRGVGGDFVDPYAASLAARHGAAASVYNIHLQHLRESAVTGGTDTGVLGFHYPPMFLLMVLPISRLPYLAAWILFEATTLIAYIAVLRGIAPMRIGLWLGVAFPAVLINIMCGQNGFLTTALIGGGLLLLDQSPILAGLLFGLMAYKPQFAILIPLALIAARRQRALGSAALIAIAFAAVSFLVFGAPTWRAFLESTDFTRKVVLEQGAIDFRVLQSVFGAVRMWGGGISTAYIFQALVAAYAATAVIWVWRTDAPFALKAATLTLGSLMGSPYVLQYDLMLLALPIAWMAMEGLKRGFLPYEKAVLSMAWLLPRISLPISMGAKIPIAPFVIVALMTTILIRCASDSKSGGRILDSR